MNLELLAFAISASAAIALCITFAGRKAALYLKLYIAACGCFALGKLFMLTAYFSSGNIPQGFNIGWLGILGCFAFLASANLGVINGIIDDGSKTFSRYRIASAASPLITAALTFPALAAGFTITTAILAIVIGISAYYSTKQILCPDMGFEFLRIIKPCNVISLVLSFAASVEMLGAGIGNEILETSADIFVAVLFIPLGFTLERGRRLWKA